MKSKLMILAALSAVFLISACGPSDADILSTADAARTEAVGTVHAQYTEWALLTPSATNTLMPTNTPAATNTLAVASATATTANTGATGGTGATGAATQDTCNVMTFVEDVTVPDGTEMSPGETFTKTWRVQNDGSCSWTTAYYLAFDSGNQLDGPESQTLTAEVAPGATADLSLELVAPDTAGSYESYWVLYSEDGAVVGVVFLQIEVA